MLNFRGQACFLVPKCVCHSGRRIRRRSPLTPPRNPSFFNHESPMLTLYSALLAQHPRQLTPVRCAEPTFVQLHRYFEDVVLENNLAALVVESFLPETQRSLRDAARAREVGQAAHHAFFFVSSDDALNSARLVLDDSERRP